MNINNIIFMIAVCQIYCGVTPHVPKPEVSAPTTHTRFQFLDESDPQSGSLSYISGMIDFIVNKTTSETRFFKDQATTGNTAARTAIIERIRMFESSASGIEEEGYIKKGLESSAELVNAKLWSYGLSQDPEIQAAKQSINNLQSGVKVYNSEFEKMIYVNYYHIIAKKLQQIHPSPVYQELHMRALARAYQLTIFAVHTLCVEAKRAADLTEMSNTERILLEIYAEFKAATSGVSTCCKCSCAL